MYLQVFSQQLKAKLGGSLLTVKDVGKINGWVKEYLHGLSRIGEVERVYTKVIWNLRGDVRHGEAS